MLEVSQAVTHDEAALVTTSAAGKIIKVTTTRIRQWVHRSQLEPVACEVHSRRLLFDMHDVQRTYLDRRTMIEEILAHGPRVAGQDQPTVSRSRSTGRPVP